jgi:hypothetical protein
LKKENLPGKYSVFSSTKNRINIADNEIRIIEGFSYQMGPLKFVKIFLITRNPCDTDSVAPPKISEKANKK